MAANGDGRRVLVTGANGTIGRAVIEHLLAKNKYEITALVRDRQKARNTIGATVDLTKVLMVDGDFERMGEREFKQVSRDVDIVVHAAGLVHKPDAPYQEYEVSNVRATQSLAEASAANNVKTFIFLSSSAVYGLGPFENIPETAPVKAATPYAVSKATSENFLQMFQGVPNILVLRPSLVYGEGDRGNLLSLIREVRDARYKHIGGGVTEKSVIYSKDVAQAIGLLIEKAPTGYQVFNVANPDPVSMKTLTEEIARCLNLNAKIPSVPEALVRAGLAAAKLIGKAPITVEQLNKLTTTTTCSVSKLVQQTGFRPSFTLESGLKNEINWAQHEKLL